MARKPQRSGRWSLRQLSLEAGVSTATARSVVKSGHLDPDRLTELDVVVLRVAAMLPALQPFNETRPANAVRQVPAREIEAIGLVRAAAGHLSDLATLVVTADGARLATTLAEVTAYTIEPASKGEPYLSLPVGHWARELQLGAGKVAA